MASDSPREALLLRLAELRRELAEVEAALDFAPMVPPPLAGPVSDAVIGMLVFEYATDLISVHAEDSRYLSISPSCTAFFGYTAEDVIGHHAYEFIHPDDFPLIAAHHATQDGRPTAPIQYRLRHKHGHYLWVETRNRSRVNAAGVQQIVCITRDVSQIKSDEATLRQLAERDAMTGILNRRSIESVLAAPTNGSIAVILIDVDAFKSINDRHGHDVGDVVVKEVVARINARLRAGDSFGRWGGDEFIVLLPGASLTGAARVAEDLRAAVAGLPFADVGQVTASFGVAEVTPGADPNAVIAAADDALYQAKRDGRNRVGLSA